jgi:hypothetical protein
VELGWYGRASAGVPSPPDRRPDRGGRAPVRSIRVKNIVLAEWGRRHPRRDGNIALFFLRSRNRMAEGEPWLGRDKANYGSRPCCNENHTANSPAAPAGRPCEYEMNAPTANPNRKPLSAAALLVRVLAVAIGIAGAAATGVGLGVLVYEVVQHTHPPTVTEPVR